MFQYNQILKYFSNFAKIVLKSYQMVIKITIKKFLNINFI